MNAGSKCTRFGGTYTKIGTIQRRLAWPLRKDDTQIREAFHIFQVYVRRGDVECRYCMNKLVCTDRCYRFCMTTQQEFTPFA